MSASITQLISELQPFARELVRAAGAAGLQPRITSTRRSSAEQARLYRRYQQGLQAYPVAPPGTSAHEYGYAFDMVVADLNTLPDVGAYWKQLGGVWGGEFNDPIHFEYPGFSPAVAAQEDSTLYKVGTFVAGLAVPMPISIGATASNTVLEYVQANPEKKAIVDFLLGFPGMTDIWSWELNLLPKWVRDILL